VYAPYLRFFDSSSSTCSSGAKVSYSAYLAEHCSALVNAGSSKYRASKYSCVTGMHAHIHEHIPKYIEIERNWEIKSTE
jgi:hypothetical protein